MATESLKDRDIAYHMHAAANLRQVEKNGPMIITRGDGVYVYDDAGNKYLEGMAGLWSVGVGFSEPRLAAAAQKQMEVLPYYHVFKTMTHQPAIELAEKLVKMAPVPMSKAHFTSSGSEANDLVIKLIWYRSNALGQPQKKKIISRINGYHGVTIASASLTGLKKFHDHFDLPIDKILHTSCPDFPKNGQPGEDEKTFVSRMAADLDAMIQKEGPETVAAFIGEPVMGAGGVIVPPAGYWEAIQAVLKKYDILLIADEVICGFGRTGQMFGSATFGMKPDVMVLSKQLTSSYMPLSAVLINEKVYGPIADESDRLGGLGHGYTASAHPVGTAVALENLKIIEERDLVGNVARLSPQFLEGLKRLSEHPLASASRGVGLIGALELKTWSKPGEAAVAVHAAAMEHGVITRPVGDAICFCPPMIITAAQITEMFDGVERALNAVQKTR